MAAPQQTKRLTPPAIALRSKSMTSELEDMGKMLERTNVLFLLDTSQFFSIVSSSSSGGWDGRIAQLEKQNIKYYMG